MKILKLLATVIVVVILLVVGVLGYAGVIPGVSKVFGADKPRDLGAAPTAPDLVAAQAKLGQTFTPLAADMTVKSVLQLGVGQVDINLSGQEWAAHLQAIHPVKDLQIKFTVDGFEAAGRIDNDRIFEAVQLLGYTQVSEAEVLQRVEKYLPGNAVFYLKGTGSMTDNKANLDIERFEVGRLSISRGAAANALTAYAETLVDKVPGLDMTVMNIDDGNLRLTGSVPSQLPRF